MLPHSGQGKTKPLVLVLGRPSRSRGLITHRNNILMRVPVNGRSTTAVAVTDCCGAWERTSPQAVHFAEVRLLLFLGLGVGLGFMVTELLASVTVR